MESIISRIQDHLKAHGYTGYPDIYEWDGDNEIVICISWGDWKHDHLYVEYLMGLMGYYKDGQETVTESNGSDCYSAEYLFRKRTKYRALSAGEYSGDLRLLARALKENDRESVNEAAALLQPLLPEDAVLIPMPSHDGGENFSTALCNALSRLSGRPVKKILKCRPHESMCNAKKSANINGTRLPHPETFMMERTEHEPIGGTPVVIDNVIASGTTAVAALDAVRNDDAMVLTLADDVSCPKIAEFTNTSIKEILSKKKHLIDQ